MRYCYITKVTKDNHIVIESSTSGTNELQLFFDTGSINLTKINCLNGESLINKNKKHFLKGI